MNRSFINEKIDQAIEFCNAMKFHLPAWAYWQADEWAKASCDIDEIKRCGLGWDVTDFGSGDYAKVGLLAFTIRNGVLNDQAEFPKRYCEKLLLTDENQVTPTHFHWAKTEDIINRGGGNLVVQLWNAVRETEEIDEQSDVTVKIDAIPTTIKAGEKITLTPGQSVTLTPYLYHNFYAQPGCGMVLGGEVSEVNDDENDNRFNPALPRFSQINEDAAKKYLLCNEY